MLNKKNVGKRIAYYRKEKGMTQQDLADYLNISHQSVSKWESGSSLPTVEMLYEIAFVLNVSVDLLLNEEWWENRGISYLDTGLNTHKLYALKNEIQQLNSTDEHLISARFADTVLFKMDTSQMKDPIYSTITCIPGSKEKLAREHGFHSEICEDVAANAMNFVLQHGLKPVMLRGMVLCGNFNHEKLYHMAQALRNCCDQNDVMFAGMEIGAQPVNFDPDMYHVSVTVTGVADSSRFLDRKNIEEGDILIGMQTEGIEGTNYPMVKVMLDRKPELIHAQVDEEHTLLDLLMRPNTAYTKAVEALQERDCLHALYRVNNRMFNEKIWTNIPQGLSACIDLSLVPILPLYRFLYEQDMIGEKAFPYHFHMGIGMIAVVPKKSAEIALELIGKTVQCWRIGQIVRDVEQEGKIWPKGQLNW